MTNPLLYCRNRFTLGSKNRSLQVLSNHLPIQPTCVLDSHLPGPAECATRLNNLCPWSPWGVQGPKGPRAQGSKDPPMGPRGSYGRVQGPPRGSHGDPMGSILGIPGFPYEIPSFPLGILGVFFIHHRDPWGDLHTPQRSLG